MKDVSTLNYKLFADIGYLTEVEYLDLDQFVFATSISKNTVYQLKKGAIPSLDTCEKFYSYAYENGFRFNQVKEELFKDSGELILFHGSKFGLTKIDNLGSRCSCDFGNGFYLGETFKNALAFVSDYKESSIYSFKLDLKGLNVLKFKCNFEWLIAICYFRNQLKEYENNELIKKVINKINSADVVIAPIADNRMFYIMSLFTSGDINVDVTMNCLSASQLGNQYIIKSSKALDQLTPIEKHYICKQEKEESIKFLQTRTLDIEEKLKKYKREFRNGKFIEEVFK